MIFFCSVNPAGHEVQVMLCLWPPGPWPEVTENKWQPKVLDLQYVVPVCLFVLHCFNFRYLLFIFSLNVRTLSFLL